MHVQAVSREAAGPVRESASLESTPEIRVARSLAEVEALREAWTAWGGHRDSDIDFYLMILASYTQVIRPHVIGIFQDGKPEAILIGRLEWKSVGFRVGYFSAGSLTVRCLTFVYGAMRGNGSAENARTLVGELLDCLKRKEADIAQFEWAPVESPLYPAAMELPGRLGRDLAPAKQAHHRLVLPETFESVFARLSGNRKKEIRRNVKRLHAHPAGEFKIVCYRDPADMDRFFQDTEEIAKKTYQRGLGATIADTPQMRMRIGLAAKKGWLRGYVLYLGERPCAFWIGMLYGKTFVSEFMGFDPEFRQFSPGTVLLTQVLEKLCERAHGDVVEDLDFGWGTAEYKELFCSETWQEACVFVFGPTLKGMAAKSLRTGAVVVDGTARKILGSALPRVKRMWRDRLARRNRPAESGHHGGNE